MSVPAQKGYRVMKKRWGLPNLLLKYFGSMMGGKSGSVELMCFFVCC